MNIILLSGGSGKRLWPLSNDIRSKQFIKMFCPAMTGKDRKCGSVAGPLSGATNLASGKLESMVQRVYRQIKTADPNANVTIAMSKAQISMVYNQIGSDYGISVEPCRRDTFPAIALATAYLADVKGVGENEAVVVCPVDPYVEDDYFAALLELSKLAKSGDSNLTLMGIEPTYPSEKYGYIIPASMEEVSPVVMFKEKPNVSTAEEYIKQGALWNGGVFAYKLSYVLNKAQELLGYSSYEDLYNNYEKLEKISFDYAVVEKEKSVRSLRFKGQWKDIGTWNTLTEAMDSSVVGDGRMDASSSNVYILNELDVPVLAMGVKDLIISASPEGVLVSDLESSSYIKPYVDDIKHEIRFAEKSWGSFKVIDVEDESLTVKVSLNAGRKMNYHSHERRDEVWIVVEGNGRAIVDGIEKNVTAGDVVLMDAGCRHTMIAGDDGLKLIEVQIGSEISAADKKKFELK